MSRENVELLRQLFDAINRGDIEGGLALANPPPEFEFVPSGVLIPDLSGVQRGPEGLRRIGEWFMAEFDDLHVEVHGLIDAGDQVSARSPCEAVESTAVPRRAGTSGACGTYGTAA